MMYIPVVALTMFWYVKILSFVCYDSDVSRVGRVPPRYPGAFLEELKLILSRPYAVVPVMDFVEGV